MRELRRLRLRSSLTLPKSIDRYHLIDYVPIAKEKVLNPETCSRNIKSLEAFVAIRKVIVMHHRPINRIGLFAEQKLSRREIRLPWRKYLGKKLKMVYKRFWKIQNVQPPNHFPQAVLVIKRNRARKRQSKEEIATARIHDYFYSI